MRMQEFEGRGSALQFVEETPDAEVAPSLIGVVKKQDRA